MATLLGSLIVIKPIREGHAFFMIQFNAVDRPGTGHTHSSGSCSVTLCQEALALFYAVFGPQLTVHGVPVTELCYIFAIVAGLGEGLTTSVGVYTGTYSLKLRAWQSART